MNQDIIREFTFLVYQTEQALKNEEDALEKNRNSFRLKTFKSFLSFIKKYSDELTDSHQLDGVTNVGKGIKQRIDEILKNGYLKEIKRTAAMNKIEKNMKLMSSLMTIVGVGEKMAKKFIDEGVKSVQDLVDMVKDGDIKVNDKVKLGLKYRNVLKTKIPRSEMDEISKFMQKAIKKFNLQGELCGSYRRKKNQSGDIDVLIMDPDIDTMDDLNDEFEKNHILKKFIKYLHEKKFLVDDITDKKITTKYMGFAKLKDKVRRIDIRFVPSESYPAALLYFTGSKAFNTEMRKKAIKLGYLLNEYGLYKVSKKDGKKKFKMIDVDNEKDIFDELEMNYVLPERRE